MQRDILKQFLRAGPTRRFDVSFFSRRLPENIPAESFLFSHSFLNNSILFKYVDLEEDGYKNHYKKISTLIYMPYDNDKPCDGGESVIFCHDNFVQLCKYKLAGGTINGNQLLGDVEKLKILDSVPTFSPFIVELAFQRANVEVPESYLQLTPEIRVELTAHLKGRLRPLIVAACKTQTATIDRAVEDLTTKMFCLNNLTDIIPLAQALRLPPEEARDVLEAWIGMTFFEYEYATLQPRLRDFAAWMSNYDPFAEPTSHQNKVDLRSLVQALREKIRAEWNDIVAISSDYRNSYDAMAFRGKLEPFVVFLKAAPTSYWRMGNVLGKLEQTVLVWNHFMRRCNGRKLPYALLFEMMMVLRSLLLAPDAVASDPGAATKAKAKMRPAEAG